MKETAGEVIYYNQVSKNWFQLVHIVYTIRIECSIGCKQPEQHAQNRHKFCIKIVGFALVIHQGFSFT